MAKNEKTSPKVASAASSVLRNAKANATAKSIAGAALAQARTSKVTSAAVAQKAARVLNAPGSGTVQKAIAATVLTQKPRR